MAKTAMPLKLNRTLPLCSTIYNSELPKDEANALFHLLLNIAGIASNVCLLSAFSGRAKLSTASFTYVRIMAVVQFVFFVIPFPLKMLTEHYQRGQTWMATNFLPLVIGLFHFMIASNVFCLSVRLQLLINYVKRCRRWSSLGWVAWRKICWIVPFGIIANVSLCFEYSLEYEICVNEGRGQVAIGRLRLSDAVKGESMKLEFIRSTPTIIFWMTSFFCVTFILSERCVLPKLGSPCAAKHIPLFCNLRPILLAIIISHSVVHVAYSITFLQGKHLEESSKLTLYAIAYTLPFPLIFIMSTTFRSHVFHILTKVCHNASRQKTSRKSSTIRRVTKHITRTVAYSKLEMENTELDDQVLLCRAQSIRAIMKEDAIYRVRFALPQSVAVIQEEDESITDRNSQELIHEDVDIESAQYLQQMQLLAKPSQSSRI